MPSVCFALCDLSFQDFIHFVRGRKNKQAGFNLILTIVTLGVVGAGTWALVTGIKATDGQVNDVWDLIGVVRQKVKCLSVVSLKSNGLNSKATADEGW